MLTHFFLRQLNGRLHLPLLSSQLSANHANNSLKLCIRAELSIDRQKQNKIWLLVGIEPMTSWSSLQHSTYSTKWWSVRIIKAFMKPCSNDNRNDQSPKCEVMHETKVTSEISAPTLYILQIHERTKISKMLPPLESEPSASDFTALHAAAWVDSYICYKSQPFRFLCSHAVLILGLLRNQ